MGWITVAAYFLTAWLCWRASQRTAGERRLWLALTLFMIALGINKQLDLQSLFTQIGRDIAIRDGWYDNRVNVQREFVYGIMAAGGGVSLLLLWFTRKLSAAAQTAAFGITALLAFIAMRASSFHHVDGLISITWRGVRFNWIFELSGIGIIAAAAALSGRGRS